MAPPPLGLELPEMCRSTAITGDTKINTLYGSSYRGANVAANPIFGLYSRLFRC